MIRPIVALLAALAVALGLAAIPLTTPADAARPRPVTITATSTCPNGAWTITATITTTRDRVVDVYDSSDYGNRLIIDTAGIPQSAVTLRAGAVYRVTYPVGASAQYTEIGVFPGGTGGWDGDADPLASVRVGDPHQTNPRAGC